MSSECKLSLSHRESSFHGRLKHIMSSQQIGGRQRGCKVEIAGEVKKIISHQLKVVVFIFVFTVKVAAGIFICLDYCNCPFYHQYTVRCDLDWRIDFKYLYLFDF